MVGWGNFDDRLAFRRWLVLVIGNILLAVLCLVASPTVTFWISGGFTPRTMFQSTSPDGRHRIVIPGQDGASCPGWRIRLAAINPVSA